MLCTGTCLLSFCIDFARGGKAGGSFFPLVHSVLNPELPVTVSPVVAAVQLQKHRQQVYAVWLPWRKTATINPSPKLFNRLRRVPPATMEKGYPANQQPLHWPSKNMTFVKTLALAFNTLFVSTVFLWKRGS